MSGVHEIIAWGEETVSCVCCRSGAQSSVVGLPAIDGDDGYTGVS